MRIGSILRQRLLPRSVTNRDAHLHHLVQTLTTLPLQLTPLAPRLAPQLALIQLCSRDAKRLRTPKATEGCKPLGRGSDEHAAGWQSEDAETEGAVV